MEEQKWIDSIESPDLKAFYQHYRDHSIDDQLIFNAMHSGLQYTAVESEMHDFLFELWKDGIALCDVSKITTLEEKVED